MMLPLYIFRNYCAYLSPAYYRTKASILEDNPSHVISPNYALLVSFSTCFLMVVKLTSEGLLER